MDIMLFMGFNVPDSEIGYPVRLVCTIVVRISVDTFLEFGSIKIPAYFGKSLNYVLLCTECNSIFPFLYNVWE
jgi:hypothetical protein